jgi:hypothetical protein
MMATTATHKLGDLSRSKHDLCCITEEDKNNYYGMWVTGLGAFDIQFPKSTTRELTEEERDFYSNKKVIVGSIEGNPSYSYKLIGL